MSEKSIIALESNGGVIVGRITCPMIGEREAPIIRAEALAAAGDGPSRVALDFSQVTMMGSLALGTLISLSKDCKGSGGRLVLFGLNSNLNDVLRMSRLDKLLPIAKSEDAALKKAR